MKIRSPQEIQSLDDDLKLFEEDSWDFLSVVDNREENYEYFNDIRDTDFDKKSKASSLKSFMPVATMITVMVACVLITIKVTGVFDYSDYDKVASIQSVNEQANTMTYVTGTEATSDELISVSKVLSLYFTTLRNETAYENLYSCCASTSVFADTYYSATNKVQTLFDTNDCYARALREFAGFFNLNQINKVIVKDGIYYCYVDLSIPSATNIQEYVHLYSYNMTKNFSVEAVNEANIVKYLLETTAENPVGVTTSEYCIKLQKQADGSFKILDDSMLLNKCIEAYTTAVSYITSILGGTLTTDM